MSPLSITTINHHKISIITEDDEIKPYSINVIAPSQTTDSTAQTLAWKQIEEVPIKDSSITIPKEITTGIYQWNWAEVEKFTSQASNQQLTKRTRTIQHAVLYPIMNRVRPFDDVEIGVGLNAKSVTLSVQQEGVKDFYQCPACMETKDGIIIRCQTKATLNTVKTCLKTKHDAVLQRITVHFTVKNKTTVAASRKQNSFAGDVFTTTNVYACGSLISYRGLNKRCDKRTKEMKFCYAHREVEDERMLMQNVWDDGKATDLLSFDGNDKEVKMVSSVAFSQIICRFVGELDMQKGVGHQ